MTTLQSTLRVSLLDDVSKHARHITGALNGMQREASAFMSPLRGLTGQLVAFGATYLGITSGFESTYTAAADAQAALTEIGIKANLSQKDLGQLQRRLTDLSPSVNQTTEDLTAGVDAMLTMGTAAKDAEGAIPGIGKAATATGASIADLASASSSAMQNLGVLPSEITRMLDGMTSAGNAGAFEMKDMASYFPQLTASAQFLGMKGVAGINDMAAALQIARRGAGDASSAANNLSDFMGKIVTPQTIKNFKKFGVDVTKELAKANKNGISPIEHFIKLIDEKTKGGKGELLTQIFGDKQTLDFIKPMIAGFDDYLKIRADADRANGTVADAYLRRMEDANQKVKSFQISMQNLGTSIGNNLLGPVAESAEYLADVFNTLDQRVTVFDRIEAATEGLFKGMGMDGADGFGPALKEFREFLFGSADASKAADDYGAVFKQFHEWGSSVRWLIDALKDNPLSGLLGEIGANGFKLMLAGVGIGFLAGAVRKLAGALFFLSGASTALAVIKGLGKIYGSISGVGGTAVAGSGARGGRAGSSNGAAPGVSGIGMLFNAVNMASLVAALPSDAGGIEGLFANSRAKFEEYNKWLEKNVGSPRSFVDNLNRNGSHPYVGVGGDGSVSARPGQTGGVYGGIPSADGSVSARPLVIDQGSISAMIQPSGVQQVQVTNPQPVTISVSNVFNITGVSSPEAAADAAASRIGQATKAAVEASLSD